jgi:hypothetical protein
VPEAPRTLPPCPQAAAARRAADTLVWTAARVQVPLPPWTLQAAVGVHCRRRRGGHGRSAAGDRHVPALLRGAAVSAAESGRPAGTWPAIPDARRTLPRCPVPRTPLGSGPGRRSRQTPTVRRSDSGRGLRTPATRRRPALWTPATAAWAGGHCGSGRLDSRQRNRPLPLACPAGNGTARCGIGQHRHGQTARSVAWCSASIWSAPDGFALLTLGGPSIWSDREGSRRIVWMINGMIKHLDRSTAGMVRRARGDWNPRPSDYE